MADTLVLEWLAWMLFGVALVFLVTETIVTRYGGSRFGWGWIGFILLACGIGAASSMAIALRALPEHPNVTLAVPLDVINLVASIALGGLGSNLLASWLTTLRPAVSQADRHSS